MWTKELFGMNVYLLVSAFIIYSMLGWLVESIYMSLCNRKLTNRGFAKSPFCPIYGFGAIMGYLLLRPFEGNYFKLYLMGAILATVFEFIVGKLMIRVFGELWWDYNDKPCNYKGIVCLESTVAWGFYAVIIIVFLHGKVMEFIGRFDMSFGQKFCLLILTVVAIDYVVQVCHALNVDMKKQREKLADKFHNFKARWY